MRFRITTIAYVFALLAAATAVFVALSLAPGRKWWKLRRERAAETTPAKAGSPGGEDS